RALGSGNQVSRLSRMFYIAFKSGARVGQEGWRYASGGLGRHSISLTGARMIEYIIVGAALLAYAAYHGSTAERRRRWLARIQAPDAPGDITDPLVSPTDIELGGHHHTDHGGDHG